MARSLGRVALFAGVVAVLTGSGCSESIGPIVDPSAGYLPATSPENVMHNFQLSYHRREIEQYAALLHPEFVFRSREGEEPPELGRDFRTRDEDSTAVAALFHSPRVAHIALDLTYGAAEPAAVAGLEQTMRIRVSPMKLTVDDGDGMTWLVEGEIQDMYFVRGVGADSALWSLIEWWDVSGDWRWPDSLQAILTSGGKPGQEY